MWEQNWGLLVGTLTATAVKASKSAGRYGDGDGLFLLVKASGSRSWVVRVQKDGKRRDFGLGSEKKISLAQARIDAAKVRVQIEVGLDPLTERRKAAGIPTFREASALVYGEQRAAWRNGKHAKQWLQTLETYAFPKLGDVSVNLIEAGQVRDLLADIWLSKNETARRVRQRIGAVIDWAVGKGYREASLPMAVINRALPKIAKSDNHHTALPYKDLPAFLTALQAKTPTPSRLALELLVLTAARSGEVRLADWSEFDVDAGLWTVPAARMKMKREHVVPLSGPALSVLVRIADLTGNRCGLVFEGMKRGKPLSDMTLTKLLRDAGLDATPHGFRSCFRDWVSEETAFDGDTAEAALAHAVKNKTEAAYRRGNQLDKRRALIAAWGGYCVGDGAAVVRLVG
jgi:integrase